MREFKFVVVLLPLPLLLLLLLLVAPLLALVDELALAANEVADGDDEDVDEVGAPVVLVQFVGFAWACSFSIFSFSRSLSRSMIRFPTLMVS